MDRKYKLFTSVMSSLLGKNGVPAPRSPSIQQLFTMGCVCVCGCFLVQVYTVGLAAILVPPGWQTASYSSKYPSKISYPVANPSCPSALQDSGEALRLERMLALGTVGDGREAARKKIQLQPSHMSVFPLPPCLSL